VFAVLPSDRASADKAVHLAQRAPQGSILVGLQTRELALARPHRVAPRSEKHIDRLFNEAEQAADEDADNEAGDVVVLLDTGLPVTEGATGKKRGRKALPENLPRERVENDLPDDQKACPCCRHQMHRMGETVTEQLHIEVKAKVLQNVRFKYVCRHCDRTGINTPVVTAPMPAEPLPGSIATASTLAFALVHKLRRRHTALPPGSTALRARRYSCQPWRSGPLGDRLERKASLPHL